MSGAKRVASAHKRPATISAALVGFPDMLKLAERLAEAVNHVSVDEEPADVESILFEAIVRGLEKLNREFGGTK